MRAQTMTTSDDEVYAYKVFHLKKKKQGEIPDKTTRYTTPSDSVGGGKTESKIFCTWWWRAEREWKEEGMRITCWRVTLSEREREVGGRDEVMKVLRVIVAASRFVWERWAVESHEHNVRWYQRDKDAIFPLQRWMSCAIIIKILVRTFVPIKWW